MVPRECFSSATLTKSGRWTRYRSERHGCHLCRRQQPADISVWSVSFPHSGTCQGWNGGRGVTPDEPAYSSQGDRGRSRWTCRPIPRPEAISEDRTSFSASAGRTIARNNARYATAGYRTDEATAPSFSAARWRVHRLSRGDRDSRRARLPTDATVKIHPTASIERGQRHGPETGCGLALTLALAPIVIGSSVCIATTWSISIAWPPSRSFFQGRRARTRTW